MELTQSREIAAPSAAVWAGLNDPLVLKACIPGCESLTRVSDTEWTTVVATRIGPVQARFKGRVTLTDIEPPSAYTLRFEGQGGAAGFASGEARVTLAPGGDAATILTYVANARVGGKIAQLGSRLVDGAAAKLADDFFARFAAHLAAGRGADVATKPGTALATESEETDGAILPAAAVPPRSPLVRYAALAGIVVVLVLLYVYRQH